MERIKKIGKIIGLLGIGYLIFVVIYKLSGTHIYKLDTNILNEIDLSDSLYSESTEIFAIQNPPDTDREIVELIYDFNKENHIEKAQLGEIYTQTYYKETWTVNRFFEPYKGGFLFSTEYNFFEGNFPEYPTENIHFIYKMSKESIRCDSIYCPNLPYFEFYKIGDWKRYTPNGTKQNPNDKGYDPFVKSEKVFAE
jgi:hypothetical protein